MLTGSPYSQFWVEGESEEAGAPFFQADTYVFVLAAGGIFR